MITLDKLIKRTPEAIQISKYALRCSLPVHISQYVVRLSEAITLVETSGLRFYRLRIAHNIMHSVQLNRYTIITS